MAGFRVYTSNRMEILVEKLAEILSDPLPSPLASEIIVVQSRGMERWVSLELARMHGICANVSFPFPRMFVAELMERILGRPLIDPRFEPSVMAWRIMRMLPHLIVQDGFEPLCRYLEDGQEELKRYELSERIAGLMDQYLIYRPDMVTAWAQGRVENEDEKWQSVLFRALVAETSGIHPAALQRLFVEKIGDASVSSAGLPERISIFGISSLPYFFMDIFQALSRRIKINLFLMNPCREFWFDIRSEWQISREMERYRQRLGPDLPMDSLYLDKGNPLLSSMGSLGREFISYILNSDVEEWDGFNDPGDQTLLAVLQSDILHLRDRSAPEWSGVMIDPHDESVQIHSCHSPMREVEVLYDRLLAMFERDSELLPKDIIVMTPDIDAYAPYITAVFDTAADDAVGSPGARRIPFSIADRGIKVDSPTVKGFLTILDLSGGRLSAAAVMSILEADIIHRKFDLTETDIELIRHWVADSGIRWGADESHRLQQGLPPYSENTWKAGLQRLLLGFAMPGHNEHLFQSILPYDHIEGEDALVLGKFVRFMSELFAKTSILGSAGTLPEWSRRLTDILAALFLADESTDQDLQFIRRVVQEMGRFKETADFEETVGMPVVRKYLESALAKEAGGFGFMTGDVTFCAMLPMRSVPFKVICLLGMNSDSYPRQVHHLGFDLMVKHPRSGDRSRRYDDRYLFIEAMLSARQTFYISYVGQSIQDNTATPPSVLVSEIMDYIVQGFNMSGGGDVERHLVTRHRLQAFNPVYFRNDRRFFSYSAQNCSAAAFLLLDGQERGAFIPYRLSEPELEWKHVELGQLLAYFRNPARFLLEKRLRMVLDNDEESLEESEPFEMKGLGRYAVAQRLVDESFKGHDTGDLWPALKASGVLPHGNIGVFQYHDIAESVARFMNRSRPFMEGGQIAPLEVDLALDDWTLSGQIGSIFAGAHIYMRYADLRGRDMLRAWVLHLIFNCVGQAGYPRRSVIIGRDRIWRLDPVENAGVLLLSLLSLYWQGLTAPLKLFPETSWHYAREVHLMKKNGIDLMRSARRIWAGDERIAGEGEDAAYRLCFRDTDPIDDEFRRQTDEVFIPLVAHLHEI